MVDKKVVLSLTAELKDVPFVLSNHFSKVFVDHAAEMSRVANEVIATLDKSNIPRAIQKTNAALEQVSNTAELYGELRSILVGLQKTHLELSAPSSEIEGEANDQIDPSSSGESE